MTKEYTTISELSALIHVPAASSVVLDEVQRKGISPPALEQALAADSTRNFVSHILREPFRPDASVHFVPFELENGVFDVVRARYMAGSFRLDVGKTLCILSIVVSSNEDNGQMTCIDRATKWGRTLLQTTYPLDLIEVGQENGMAYGKQGRGRALPNPYWEDDLHWWCTDGEVGFLTFASGGAPGRGVYSFGREENRNWFRFFRR